MDPRDETQMDSPYRPHPHLYEINTWAWLTELSRKQGRRIRLGEVPDREWDVLEAKGFDFLWLMGIWQRSPESRRIARSDPPLLASYDRALPGWRPDHVVGSPYAIKAYRPDPELATWDDLGQVREKLHRRGIKLVLDFVPNHTARDHLWVGTHPEYYVTGTAEDARRNPDGFFEVQGRRRSYFVAHGKDPYFPAWSDTAQLNYFNPATRTAMLKELRSIAKHCDGVRCDMAMLVLNDVFAKTWTHVAAAGRRPDCEFWTEAIGALPGFVWIAEVYWDLEWHLQQLGFQFTYDKRLYDRLRSASPQDVARHLTADPAYQSRLVRFLENHDEPRSAAVFGKDRLPAVGTLVATLPGMRLYHQGQLEGKRIRLPVQLCMAADEVPDQGHLALYDRMLRIAGEDVFHHGRWRLLEVHAAGDSSHENLIAYQWRSSTAWKIIVVNLDAAAAHGRVRVQDDGVMGLGVASAYVFSDQLNDQVYERPREHLMQEGLAVRLDGFGAHIFAVSPAPLDRP